MNFLLIWLGSYVNFPVLLRYKSVGIVWIEYWWAFLCTIFSKNFLLKSASHYLPTYPLFLRNPSSRIVSQSGGFSHLCFSQETEIPFKWLKGNNIQRRVGFKDVTVDLVSSYLSALICVESVSSVISKWPPATREEMSLLFGNEKDRETWVWADLKATERLWNGNSVYGQIIWKVFYKKSRETVW